MKISKMFRPPAPSRPTGVRRPVCTSKINTLKKLTDKMSSFSYLFLILKSARGIECAHSFAYCMINNQITSFHPLSVA